MKTAFRRELEAAGWRILGFFGALFLLGIGTVLWGLHIEGRVDRVVVERQHDHRVIERLAQGRPLHPHRKAQANSETETVLHLGTSGGPVLKTTPDIGTTEGVKAPKGVSPKPPGLGNGGSKGEKQHAAVVETPPEPAPEPSPEASTSSPPPEQDAGNSGETPAAQNAVGVKACIEVAVSACADAGLPKPNLP